VRGDLASLGPPRTRPSRDIGSRFASLTREQARANRSG
jgi:hypothetical protein